MNLQHITGYFIPLYIICALLYWLLAPLINMIILYKLEVNMIIRMKFMQFPNIEYFSPMLSFLFIIFPFYCDPCYITITVALLYETLGPNQYDILISF